MRGTGAPESESRSTRAPASGLDFKLLGCSDAAVSKASSHGWTHWLAVLDRFGVRTKGHAAAATHLSEDHGCDAWWAQMIVVGYERVRGLRDVREKSDGYSATASRTISADTGRVFDALEIPALAAKWLPQGVVVHKVTRPKSARLTWTDGGKTLSIWASQKRDKSGGFKTTVQIQHDKLLTEAACQRMRRLWAERMDALKTLVEGSA